MSQVWYTFAPLWLAHYKIPPLHHNCLKPCQVMTCTIHSGHGLRQLWWSGGVFSVLGVSILDMVNRVCQKILQSHGILNKHVWLCVQYNRPQVIFQIFFSWDWYDLHLTYFEWHSNVKLFLMAAICQKGYDLETLPKVGWIKVATIPWNIWFYPCGFFIVAPLYPLPLFLNFALITIINFGLLSQLERSFLNSQARETSHPFRWSSIKPGSYMYLWSATVYCI